MEALSKVDPATNHQAELLVDTNVVLEYLSFGDLLREGDKHRNAIEQTLFGDAFDDSKRRRGAEAAWRSKQHRYRQLRARSSIILMWVLAERRLLAAMLGKEALDLLEKVSPRPCSQTPLLADGTSYALTTAIVYAIHPMLTKHGLHLGVLTEVNHRARGNKADAELLRLAQRDGLPIVTNEGYTVTGLSDFKSDGSKSLRGLARDAQVKAYSPREFLDWLRVDGAHEAVRFIKACERPVIDEYLRVGPRLSYLQVIDHNLDREIESKAYAAALEQVIPFYRLILLDERDEALEAIPPPVVPH